MEVSSKIEDPFLLSVLSMITKLCVFPISVALACSEEHFWGYNEGYSCCKYYFKASDPESDLVFEDPEEECQDGEYVPCHATNGAARCRDKDGEKKEIVFNSCIMC